MASDRLTGFANGELKKRGIVQLSIRVTTAAHDSLDRERRRLNLTWPMFLEELAKMFHVEPLK